MGFSVFREYIIIQLTKLEVENYYHQEQGIFKEGISVTWMFSKLQHTQWDVHKTESKESKL